jgi:cold shock CspA family protein
MAAEAGPEDSTPAGGGQPLEGDPHLLNPRRILKGVVVSFDAKLGIGVIASREAGSVRFHCTEIADGSRSIERGSRVVFLLRPSPVRGWEAVSVTKVGFPDDEF